MQLERPPGEGARRRAAPHPPHTGSVELLLLLLLLLLFWKQCFLWEQINTPLLRHHPDRLTIKSRRNTLFVRMPRGCSSDQPRIMDGLSGWSAFSGVCICFWILYRCRYGHARPKTSNACSSCLSRLLRSRPQPPGCRGPRPPAASPVLIHPVSIRRFPSFRTQPLENLSHYLRKKTFLSNPAPGENLLSGNLVMETGCMGIRLRFRQVWFQKNR